MQPALLAALCWASYLTSIHLCLFPHLETNDNNIIAWLAVGGGVVEIDKKMNLKLLNSLDLFNQR